MTQPHAGTMAGDGEVPPLAEPEPSDPPPAEPERVVMQAWPTGAEQPLAYSAPHTCSPLAAPNGAAHPQGVILPSAGSKDAANGPASGHAATPDVSGHERVSLLLSGISRSGASPKVASGGGSAGQPKKRASGVRRKAGSASAGKGAKDSQTPGLEGAKGATSEVKAEGKATSSKANAGGKGSRSKGARGGSTPALRKVRLCHALDRTPCHTRLACSIGCLWSPLSAFRACVYQLCLPTLFSPSRLPWAMTEGRSLARHWLAQARNAFQIFAAEERVAVTAAARQAVVSTFQAAAVATAASTSEASASSARSPASAKPLKVDENSAAFKKELKQAVVSELGRAWRNLSADEKAKYEARARDEKALVLKDAQSAARRVATSGEDGYAKLREQIDAFADKQPEPFIQLFERLAADDAVYQSRLEKQVRGEGRGAAQRGCQPAGKIARIPPPAPLPI